MIEFVTTLISTLKMILAVMLAPILRKVYPEVWLVGEKESGP